MDLAILQKRFKRTYSYKILRYIRTSALYLFEIIGHISYNLLNVIKDIFQFKLSFSKTVEQSAKFGVDSLLLTLLIVGVSGMIIALQVAYEMVKQGAGIYVGSLVSLIIVREIGPIMGSFSIISMVGSSMAAELATMKVTSQIDAMKVLKVDPSNYLITPRVIAGTIIMPFVIIIASTTGILAGLLSSKMVTEINYLTYFDSVWQGLTTKDVWICVLKSSVFGCIIALVSSTFGYRAEGGAIDVGKATTSAVVWSFVLVVIFDYIVSLIFFQ